MIFILGLGPAHLAQPKGKMVGRSKQQNLELFSNFGRNVTTIWYRARRWSLSFIFSRTGDWWKNYGWMGNQNTQHCMSSNMYSSVLEGSQSLRAFRGYKNVNMLRGKWLFDQFNPSQIAIDSAEYPFQMLQWYHCRMNLSFACEGTAVHPNHHY